MMALILTLYDFTIHKKQTISSLFNYLMIIMVISMCYFSREHMAIHIKNGVNIELGKNNRSKAMCMIENHT